MYLKLHGHEKLMANLTANNRVIHRFIRDISDYERGGRFYSQIIPLDTQAYAIYPIEDDNRFFYVIGDGEHTYTELRDGKGKSEVYTEYPVLTKENLRIIGGDLGFEVEERKKADRLLHELIEEEKKLREAADKLLQQQIDDNDESMSILNSKLEEEIDVRSHADEDLSLRLAKEIKERKEFDELIDDALAEEISNRETAEEEINKELDKKLDKVSTPSVLYGTDENGAQTVYGINDFDNSKVNDVKVGDTSVVVDKVAVLGTMAMESKESYVSKEVIEQSLDNKQDKLTDEQLAAINSGVTAEKISDYDEHIADKKIHVTEQDRENWDNKQDVLAAGDGISIENGVIINTRANTYAKFPDTWTTNDTLEHLVKDISNDKSAKPGMAYLGEVSCDGLPFDGNAELSVLIMTDGVALLKLTSGTVSPYSWQMTTVDGNLQDWISYIPTENLEEEPKEHSKGVVTSGGIYSALQTKANTSDVYTKNEIDEMVSKPLVVTMIGGGDFENGSKVDIELHWDINKEIVSQSLNQGIGELDKDVRDYKITNVDSTKEFVLTVNDGKETISTSVDVKFVNKIYWGTSNQTVLANNDILAFSNELATSREQTRVFDCTGGKYFYFAIPTNMCEGLRFITGGLPFTAMSVETITLTNFLSHMEQYNLYRSDYIQTGSAIQVQVA